MREFIFLLSLLVISIFVSADEFGLQNPLHSAEEVSGALYDQAGLKRSDAKIVIFSFDYTKGIWHIELEPAKKTCLDCYPAYYFKNKKNLVLESVPHG